MKNICINPVFMALQGNFNAQDEHGHKEVLRFRETAWGTKSFGLGANAKRDLVNKPYSSDELAQHSAFAQAQTKRKQIVSTSALKLQWRAAFNAAQKAGTTACKTLNGYITQQLMAGKADESGAPRA